MPVVRHHRLEQRLADAASQLVGAPVQVHCQTAGQEFVDAGAELGWVAYGPDGVPEHATLIKRAQCGDLSAYLGSDKTAPTLDQVIAVHILSHEARHMAGETSEGVAECEAMQRDAQTAELLGADRDQALGWPRPTGGTSTRACPTTTCRRTAVPAGRWTRACRTRPGRSERRPRRHRLTGPTGRRRSRSPTRGNVPAGTSLLTLRHMCD